MAGRLPLGGRPPRRAHAEPRPAGGGRHPLRRGTTRQTAPCGPSRASLFTGLYAHNHRSVGNGTPLDARFTNLALELRAGGYDPVLFGYTDTTVDPRTVGPDDPRLYSYEGLLPGFRWGAELLEDRRPWRAWLAEQGHDPDGPLRRYVAACERWTWDLTLADVAEPAPFPAEHSETAWLTDRALEHLAEVEEPWCVHVAYIRPHPPFIAPPPYHRLHDPADGPAPVRHRTVDDEAAVHPYLAMILGSPAYRAPADEAVLRQLRATYYGMVAEVDAQFGRLLAGVEAKGELGDTVVVVTSDHGEMLGDHWLVGKVGFHRESYHVPLIVGLPAAATPADGAGGVVDEWTEHVDLLPTVLELVGLPVPVQGDGRSLVPLVGRTRVAGSTAARGPAAGWRDATHWEFDYRAWSSGRDWDPRACSLTAQRDGGGAYVHFGALAPLYFDLAEDPHQMVDRVGDPGCRDAVLHHAQRLLSWEQATRATTSWRRCSSPRAGCAAWARWPRRADVLQQRPPVRQWRRGGGEVLGPVVEPPQGDGRFVPRPRREPGDAGGVERAALADEGAGRAVGQQLPVGRVGGAQVALGHHVQADRGEDVVAEERRQPVGAGVLVVAVGPAAVEREEVADVVEQGGGDGGRRTAGGGRELGALAGVARLRDDLVVGLVAESPVQVEHLVERGGGGPRGGSGVRRRGRRGHARRVGHQAADRLRRVRRRPA